MNIDINTAKSLALAFIEAHIQAKKNNRFLIVDVGIVESTEGWFFPFQTEQFLKTRDIQYSVVGNWPVFVSKDGATVEQRRPDSPPRL